MGLDSFLRGVADFLVEASANTERRIDRESRQNLRNARINCDKYGNEESRQNYNAAKKQYDKATETIEEFAQKRANFNLQKNLRDASTAKDYARAEFNYERENDAINCRLNQREEELKRINNK